MLSTGIRYLKTQYLSRRLDNQRQHLDKLRETDDWLLIVLDACRYDRFDALYSKYLEADVNCIFSAEHNTFGYVQECWPETYDYPYITGAAPITNAEFDFSDDSETAYGIDDYGEDLRIRYQGYVPSEHLLDIEEVWREYWSEDLGVCPPEPVTDVALQRASHSDRMVVHYFQPHTPYIGEHQRLGDLSRVNQDETLRGGAIDFGIWEAAERGEISRGELLTLYDSNLHRVLMEVVRLIDNTEFRQVVIMGDHGEALGEYDCYSHGNPMHPQTRLIPWAEVESVNSELLDSYTPADYESSDIDAQVGDRLKALGYL